MPRILLLMMLLFTTLPAFAQTPLVDSTAGYSLDYPSDWKLRTDLKTDTPGVTSRFCLSHEGSSLLLMTAPSTVSSEQFARDNLEQLAKAGVRMVMPLAQEEGLETIGGQPAFCFGYRVRDYRLTSYAVVYRGTGYLFTCADKLERVRESHPAMVTILAGLRFTP